ncbi:MAG: hypothetical protein ABSB75_01970 [Candidatus Limnocylindrales bacterium]|jgi:hypothetical protein
MSGRRPISACQRRLLALWAVLGGLALVVVLAQIAPGGVYATHAGEVLDWFLPTVVPTFSLMLGSVIADIRSPEPGASVDAFTYRLAVWISILYLGLVILILLIYAQSPTPVEELKGSGKLIAALYSAVGIVLGGFFVTRRSK